MNIAEKYNQLHVETENVIRTYAPKREQDVLIKSLLPAIRLKASKTTDEGLAIGSSKFGGLPDVPLDFEWPLWKEVPHFSGSYPLSFLCQINLDDVAPFDFDNLLPKKGLLSFFMANHDGWDCAYTNEDKGGWRVFYFAEHKLERKSCPEDLEGFTGIGCAKIDVCPLWTISENDVDVKLTDEELKQAYVFIEQWSSFSTSHSAHFMFGHPDLIQDDPRYFMSEPGTQYKDLESKDDWLLLLQMSSDEEIGFDYCDNGRIYFVIHKEDLAARNFEKVIFDGQQ